jgi:hypothetical protein
MKMAEKEKTYSDQEIEQKLGELPAGLSGWLDPPELQDRWLADDADAGQCESRSC